MDGRIGPDPVTSPTSIWAFWTSAALRPSSVSRFSRWCTSAHIFWSHMKIAISTIASGICKGRASTNQRVRLQLHLTATCGHPEVKGKIQFLPPKKKKWNSFHLAGGLGLMSQPTEEADYAVLVLGCVWEFCTSSHCVQESRASSVWCASQNVRKH